MAIVFGMLLAGATLGKAVSRIYDIVESTIEKTRHFKSKLAEMQNIIDDMKPLFMDMEKLNKALDQRKERTKKFIIQLKEAEELILECERIQSGYWNRCAHAWKLDNMNKSLKKFMDSGLKWLIVRNVMQSLARIERGLEQASLRADNVGPNIYYVTLPEQYDIEAIIKNVLGMNQEPDFDSGEVGIQQLGSFLGENKPEALYVLGDLRSDSLILVLKLKLLGTKILVTSREAFNRFSTYHWPLLKDRDATGLFNHVGQGLAPKGAPLSSRNFATLLPAESQPQERPKTSDSNYKYAFSSDVQFLNQADEYFEEQKRPQKRLRASPSSLQDREEPLKSGEFLEINQIYKADLEDKKRHRAELEKMRLKEVSNMEERLQREQKEKDLNFYVQSHDHLSGQALKATLEYKKEIASRWGWDSPI